MTPTLCGHERKELRRALDFANNSTLDTVSRDWPRPNEASGALLHDVHSPAKLAELLAEALRERGVDVASVERTCMALPHGNVMSISQGFDGRIFVRLLSGGYIQWQQTLTPPNARALLLRVLSLPAGATVEDVMKAVEAP
jgi:hypothetical protein